MAEAKNGEQAALWNGKSGHAWVELQSVLDAAFRPFAERLVQEIADEPRFPVLDVGCGTGATTRAIARANGSQAAVVGIDVSAPMLAFARERALREGSPATFVEADAETHDFPAATFGTIVSRFGVMFFEDPVRAFSNLRRAAQDDARLVAFAWRAAAENPFMTTAERAAAPLLPELPPRRTGGPGQFAFADAQHVSQLLEAAGWSSVTVDPMNVVCTFPASELPRYVTMLGPVGGLLQGADEATRAKVMATVLPAFAPWVHGAEVRFEAACWRVAARARARDVRGGAQLR